VRRARVGIVVVLDQPVRPRDLGDAVTTRQDVAKEAVDVRRSGEEAAEPDDGDRIGLMLLAHGVETTARRRGRTSKAASGTGTPKVRSCCARAMIAAPSKRLSAIATTPRWAGSSRKLPRAQSLN